jgi:hypothetical protein
MHIKPLKAIIFSLTYKYSVRTSQKTYHAYAKTANMLMQFRETVVVYRKHHRKAANTLLGRIQRCSVFNQGVHMEPLVFKLTDMYSPFCIYSNILPKKYTGFSLESVITNITTNIC